MNGVLRPVNSILIAGGGSSGWMAAACLSRLLLGVKVTVVESPSVPTIGVGEATIPFLRSFMTRIGFADDRLWMAACDATFKTGISFENWLRPGDHYWHPFEYLDYLDLHTHSGHCWLHLHASGEPAFADKTSFYDRFFCSTALNVVSGKVPAYSEYAYHFDAAQFGQLLQQASQVTHVRDDIVDVSLEADGAISHVVTRTSGDLRADLYVDCTGFRRLLAGRVGPENRFQSYDRSLFCDRAVVLRIPYGDEDAKRREMRPFVKAAASRAGWIWTIPLYSKISSGYVYCSAFASEDEAERTLRELWGEDRTAGQCALKLKFETGKLERPWNRNCVAIGLAGGFIEPLESTGLAITQMGVETLASMLDARFYTDAIVSRYNAQLDKFYADIMHFIVAHYCFTEREDSRFWRAVKHETAIPDELQARLAVFRRYLPTAATKGTNEAWMFRDISWFSVLLGMNFSFDVPRLENGLTHRIEPLLAEKRRIAGDLAAKLPDHYDYLQHIHR